MQTSLYLIVLLILLLIVAALVAVSMWASPCLSTTGGGGIFGAGPFRLRVSDPEYTALLDGMKTVEARLDRPPFSQLAAGDTVVVIRSRPKDDTSEYPGGKYKHDSKIVRITKYDNVTALLKGEGVAKVYPGSTEADAKKRFGMYLPPGTSDSERVIAIELRAQGDHRPDEEKKKTKRAV